MIEANRDPHSTRTLALLFSALVLFFLCPAVILQVTGALDPRFGFGPEFGNIAAALAAGRGFADPFGVPSGPTSWAAPVYPILLSAVFKVLGTKTLGAFWVATSIKSVALAASGCMLFRFAQTLRAGAGAWVVVAAYLLLLISHPWSLVYGLGDEWLLILTSTLLLTAYCNLVLNGRNPGIAFGLLGGFSALVHPALGLVFIAFVLQPSNGFALNRRALMAVTSVLVITPWVARNYVEFERIIPVKGNAAFEAYLGNELAPSGIYTSAIFGEHHPANDNSTRAAYLAEGELAFFDRHKDLSIQAIRSDPMDYMRKIGNRLVAIFVIDLTNLQENRLPSIAGMAKGLLYLLPALVLFAWILLGRHRLPARVLMIHLLFLLSFSLPFLVIGFYARYRLPVVPVFASLMGLMIIDIVHKARERPVRDRAIHG